MKLLLPSRQQLVHIRLMTHVKHEAILWRIKDKMHRQRQFHHTQIGPNVPTRLRHPHNQPRPYLLGQLRQLRNRQLLHICGRVYRLKNIAHPNLFRKSRPSSIESCPNHTPHTRRDFAAVIKYINPATASELLSAPPTKTLFFSFLPQFSLVCLQSKLSLLSQLPAKVCFTQMIPAVTTTGLTRRFGDFTAVQDVNLTVAPGQFFGFLGPNGAGKSTTIKMLTGLLAPTSGSIQILGLDALANPIEVKRQIGVVPEGLALFGRLTAAEYLRFVGRMYGLDAATTAARTEELLDFMSLANETKKLITDFSHGMQKKLALAAAVIHGPKVLFLDEPFEGVDAIASGTLKAMLQGMIARGATIFLTSHVLEIVERLCTHIAIIDRGRLIADGSLEELRAGVQARNTTSIDTQTLTLEQIFLSIVGNETGAQQPEQELSWLG